MKHFATTERARELRAKQSKAERIFWSRVRNRQLDGWKVRRQVPIGPYIADFYIDEVQAIIELDGGQHCEDDHMEKDFRRDQWFEKEGYSVFRIWNMHIYNVLNETLDYLAEQLRALSDERKA